MILINNLKTATFMFPEDKAKTFKDSKVTAIEYIPNKKIFISGFSVYLLSSFFNNFRMVVWFFGMLLQEK